MRPFNLEEAIQGKPLVTRDGRKVTDFFYFKTANCRNPISAVIDGDIYAFKINGEFVDKENPVDLFMYEEPKTYYANVYRYSDEMILISNGIVSKEEIMKHKNRKNYIKTIEITI